MKYVTGSTVEVANTIARSEVISLDLETTGLDPLSSKPRLISVNAGGEIYVVDCFKACIRPLVAALSDYDGITVGHNLKFDARFLKHHYELDIRNPFDTLASSQLLYNGREPDAADLADKNRHSKASDGTMRMAHNLYAVFARELGMLPPTEDLGASNWSLPELSSSQIAYAASDVEPMLRLREVMRAKLEAQGLLTVAGIEFGAIAPLVMLENTGFALDTAMWAELANTNSWKAGELRAQLLTILPSPLKQLGLFGALEWNLDSTEQLLDSLRRFGLNISDTQDATLAEIKHPVGELLRSYREYSKASSAFGLEYLKHVKNGRIHASYWPFLVTGRLACRQPNLQQIPGGKFRECFRPTEGRALVIGDLSQVELRILAELTQDEAMIEAFNTGEDLHTKTARAISGKENPSKDDRKGAKPLNFGVGFGMGPPKLVKYAKTLYGVEMTEAEGREKHAKWHSTYRRVKPWHHKVTSQKGPVRTIAGRLRHLPPDAYSDAINHGVQGSAADGMKVAMRLMYERLPAGAWLVNVVHDEAVVDCSADQVEEVKAVVKSSLEDGLQWMIKSVPILAEVGAGESWGAKG